MVANATLFLVVSTKEFEGFVLLDEYFSWADRVKRRIGFVYFV